MKSVLTVVLLCSFAVFSITLKNQLREDKSPIDGLKIGQQMPDFTLADSSGKEFTFSKRTSGKKLVVINFWASWCGPCRVEMPGFEKLYASSEKDGLLILAVDEDDDIRARDAYLKDKPVSFPVLFDRDSAFMKQIGVRAFPTTVLVGGDGKVRQVQEGVQDYLEYEVANYLKSDGAK